MNNETFVTFFYILPFSGETRNKPIITAFFFLIYVAGVVINSSIITVICLDVQLHKPMYLFICNLSIVDIFFTSVAVPKLLYILLSGDHLVPLSQCYTQLYFFATVGMAEEILLFIMAYDRYVAICNPLHYPQILSQRNCTFLIFFIWAGAFVNSLVYTVSAFYMSSCRSNIIHQFFCNGKSLTKTSCTTSQMFSIVDGLEMLLMAAVPLLCTCISYGNIFTVIYKMKSKENRRKAFSTCSSHVTVICLYYGTSISEYLIPPCFDALDVIFDVVYTTITPVLNPIIYSLQNNNVKNGFARFLFTRQQM